MAHYTITLPPLAPTIAVILYLLGARVMHLLAMTHLTHPAMQDDLTSQQRGILRKHKTLTRVLSVLCSAGWPISVLWSLRRRKHTQLPKWLEELGRLGGDPDEPWKQA